RSDAWGKNLLGKLTAECRGKMHATGGDSEFSGTITMGGGEEVGVLRVDVEERQKDLRRHVGVLVDIAGDGLPCSAPPRRVARRPILRLETEKGQDRGFPK